MSRSARSARRHGRDDDPADDAVAVDGSGLDGGAGLDDGAGPDDDAVPENDAVPVDDADLDGAGLDDADLEDDRPTPAVVVGAVAAGVVPVPFLVVYAGLFLVKGLIVRADRPEITGSHGGEALAGVVALVLLVLVASGLSRLHSGRGSLVHLIAQVIVLAGAIRFLAVSSSGDPQIPVLLLVGAVISIGLTLSPTSRRWARLPSPGRRRNPAPARVGEAATPDAAARAEDVLPPEAPPRRARPPGADPVDGVHRSHTGCSHRPPTASTQAGHSGPTAGTAPVARAERGARGR